MIPTKHSRFYTLFQLPLPSIHPSCICRSDKFNAWAHELFSAPSEGRTPPQHHGRPSHWSDGTELCFPWQGRVSGEPLPAPAHSSLTLAAQDKILQCLVIPSSIRWRLPISSSTLLVSPAYHASACWHYRVTGTKGLPLQIWIFICFCFCSEIILKCTNVNLLIWME